MCLFRKTEYKQPSTPSTAISSTPKASSKPVQRRRRLQQPTMRLMLMKARASKRVGRSLGMKTTLSYESRFMSGMIPRAILVGLLASVWIVRAFVPCKAWKP
jgi:hypothetical protein